MSTKINDLQLSEHFNLIEFECPCCHQVKLHPYLIEALEELRLYIASRPIIITSGYRCKRHNKEIPGAAPNSDHLQGWAADIVVKGMDPLELALAAGSLEHIIKRVGKYDDRSCVHVGIMARRGFPNKWGF